MSNIFKASRNNNSTSYSSSTSRNNYFLNKKKLEPSSFILKEELFPQLNKKKDIFVNNDLPLNINIKNNFTTLFKNKENEEKETEVDSAIEKDGWVTLKKQVINLKNQNPKKETGAFQEEKEKEVVVDPRIVFEKLTKSYEKWKKNYIELWGYDDYEKYYRFPNYDYSYLESESELEVTEEEEIFME
jgi:hypothetical protein